MSPSDTLQQAGCPLITVVDALLNEQLPELFES